MRVQNGTVTPPHRRSVQFARSPPAEDEAIPSPLRKIQTLESDNEADRPANLREREKQGSFLGRFKALATPSGSSPSHTRVQSNSTGFATPNIALSPQSERSEPVFSLEPSEAADADFERGQESDEAGGDNVRPRKRRKSRRPQIGGSESAPTTPRQSRFASFLRDRSVPAATNRPDAPSRRNTFSDASDAGHAAVSEDEGRDRMRVWRRGLSHSASKPTDGEVTNGHRPSHFRRFTTRGFDGSSSPFRTRGENGRQESSNVQRWRQVLRTIGQRRKEERLKVDHQKSAQLMAELLAGAPAALVFASMFQRDEKKRHKVPVLLEQLKLSIPHSETRQDSKGDRHAVFRIELEYGSGPARMQWAIRRTLADFVQLHAKYKGASTADKIKRGRGDPKGRAKMPKFPKSAFPYARGVRGLFDRIVDEDEDEEAPHPAADVVAPVFGTAGDASGTDQETPQRPSLAGRKHTRRKSSYAPPRRTSTGELIPGSTDHSAVMAQNRERYNDYQRRKLATYLQQMIRWLIFRADANRLCRFLEISALALRLGAEGGWQGKQGLLTIASRPNKEMRTKAMAMGRLMVAADFKERHKPRWFLVRQSYVVCVDGPESLTPYDVFLVDSDSRTEQIPRKMVDQKTAADMAKAAVDTTATGNHHIIRLWNAERKLKLVARTERAYLQFHESIQHMIDNTIWAKKQRFASYAPVRNNVWCRWLVDGRDHMWQVSRAIDNAKDFIYIHDWWLSPELYLRRPAAVSQKWRLDRLLQRKAQEGVKIFVIVYRNIESAIPIQSDYTKWSLLDLHENICVQRSPNQFRQNQFFWAHHEKLVVIDNMMAFVGGIDLCFGRWDDSCHSLTDDKSTGFELDPTEGVQNDNMQMWPGKDYSNPRVQDFYALDRPYEEMYDRTKVPRMPWHDIHMQLVGQPARDIARHFVQRWNYVLRSRVATRPTPVLLPPPEYDAEELERLGMTGTCQVQIVRSCSPWSIGTPNKVEHSIMNAYVHLIETSEHFVYIENQFYISSCTVEGTPINNSIGDALYNRALKAHRNNEQWQACLIIPLIPGFQNTVDSQDGTSVRLIMQCQFRSICRGEASLFGRLRAKGIEPEDYIRFYSLRQWGKIGPRKCLTTEQLYIHAKCMVVDDRTVIIGSANINERSMLGSRDSEVCAIVTDTKMLPSFMGGEPYEVGEFAHTLRMRLMREHLGVDIDALYRGEQAGQEREMDNIYRAQSSVGLGLDGEVGRDDYFSTPPGSPHLLPPPALTEQNLRANSVDEEDKRGRKSASDLAMPFRSLAGTTQVTDSGSGRASIAQSPQLKGESKREALHDLDVDGFGTDNMHAIVGAGIQGLTDTFVDAHGHEVILRTDAPGVERIRSLDAQDAVRGDDSIIEKAEPSARPPWPIERGDTVALGLMPRSQLPELPALDDTDIGGPPLTRGQSSASAKVVNPLVQSLRRPEVHIDCMTDPLALGFYHDIWHTIAENNTKLYRQVFRCMPDSEVLDWKAYERFNDYNERFMQSQGLGTARANSSRDAPDSSGPPGSGGPMADAASSIVPSVLEKGTADRQQKHGGLLHAVVDRLRPGSKSSHDPGRNPEMSEKDRPMPGSPGSGASSGPTVVPSPDLKPLSEKEAAKQLDGISAADMAYVQTQSTRDTTGGNSFERKRTVQYSDSVTQSPEIPAMQPSSSSTGLQQSASQRRRRRATTKSSARVDDILSKEEAEGLLKLVQGSIVLWPYDWLEKEEKGGNWLYSIDQLAPLEIYD
ncbi:hypothetical protein BAUCODRAFT_77697 [Baudoinia panamericana UAMH 10762]|uniref:Phospholipase D1 n=1 Tax=Baudoinia panamericana (strain UAMH 10762) TaxID=717646 RepID=M2M842_BAUPA|nr:uncharacterized protein BAUCODRAFT_77697 [Baudoinia panamericana UAMH 10762]EMC92501.1 hypothetical protein BAUCODRAFT_77697 [Baudoinia panamericana UAMH 10762]